MHFRARRFLERGRLLYLAAATATTRIGVATAIGVGATTTPAATAATAAGRIGEAASVAIGTSTTTTATTATTAATATAGIGLWAPVAVAATGAAAAPPSTSGIGLWAPVTVRALRFGLGDLEPQHACHRGKGSSDETQRGSATHVVLRLDVGFRECLLRFVAHSSPLAVMAEPTPARAWSARSAPTLKPPRYSLRTENTPRFFALTNDSATRPRAQSMSWSSRHAAIARSRRWLTCSRWPC